MKTRIFLLALLSIAAASAQQYPNVRLLSTDASGLTIEFTPSFKTSKVHGETGDFTRYTFESSQSLPAVKAGTPDLQFIDVILGVPAKTGNIVRVVRSEYVDVPSVALAPVPNWKRNDDGELIPVYSYTEKTNSETNDLPVVARIVKSGIARDRIIAALRLTPLEWDRTTRSLRTYSRIVVRIEFGSPDEPLSPQAFDPTERATFILNDAQSRSWRIVPNAQLRKSTAATLANGDWYRIETTEDGMYKLTRSWFEQSGINVATIDPRTIKIFGSGGRELPMGVGAPRPDDMQELAIEVVGGDDGKFDANDYVIFFGEGLSGFRYDSTSRRYSHYMHRFDSKNGYVLTFGGAHGKRMASRAPLNDPAAFKPQWFTGRAFVEDEKINFLRSGREWFGQKIAAGASVDYSAKLDGVISSQPIVVRSRVAGRSATGNANSFTLTEHGATLCSIPLGNIDLSFETSPVAWISPIAECLFTASLPDNRSVVRFAYDAASAERTEGGHVDWVEWYYARSFAPIGDVLRFSAPDTTATIEYTINGFSNSDVATYDVSDYKNVQRIALTGANISGGTLRFQSANSLGAPREFIALTSQSFKAPPTARKLPNSDLMTTSGAEFIIVTAAEFEDAAKRLKAHRETLGEDFLSTKVVTMQQVYNEFNTGVNDPAALRNFLQYAYRNWSVKPKYVLLFGNGHYDFLLRTTSERIWVPVFETENSIAPVDTYPTDDYFGQIAGSDEIVDLRIGRIPVQSSEEASEAVDKIISYETAQAFDTWRDRITFVGDDGPAGARDEGQQHTEQSERLAKSIPSEFEQKKIYIVDYKTEFSSAGRRKPDANVAIVDQINAGTVVINYTGHGNESVWTHERVFVADATIPQLKNKDRLTFFCTATCTFGLYDVPDLRSGAEEMLIKPDGGAIGGLASPRIVFSNENESYNVEFFRNIIIDGRETDGRARRIGEGHYRTKQQLFSSAGFEKFHLFGDPTTRLRFPRYSSVVDEVLVNAQPISGDTITLSALNKVTLRASVRKADGSPWPEFNGVAQVSLFDAKRFVSVAEWPGFKYELPGGLLYRGQATITDGNYELNFVVPKDISYENNAGRISLYIENGSVDGIGYSTKLKITGSDTTTHSVTPPKVQLYLDSRAFKPGDVVNENARLIVDLYDDFGINTTGNAIGHNIEAWLDDKTESIVLNDYYRSKIDSYQEGTAEYPLHDLAPGRHAVRLRAWNIFNVSTTVETYFDVASSGAMTIRNVVNYPNPMRDATTFTFAHNMSEPVNATIKIFTATGHLIKTLHANNTSDRFIRIEWDGRDEDGDAPANGIYFYKVIVNTVSGDRGSEVLEKLAVVR